MEPFLIMAGICIAYLLPSIIAKLRGHRNMNSICVVNLFLGWTVLGWVITLAWSASDNTAKEPLGQA